MGIAELREKAAGELKKLGIDPVLLESGDANMPGDYLVFEEQILQTMPKPNLARFALFIVRSDLEGREGAWESIEKLAALNKVSGIQTGGAKLYGYKGGLYTYMADINIIWPK